jgi:hypothetical protein
MKRLPIGMAIVALPTSCVLLAALATCSLAVGDAPGQPRKIDKPLIAYWTFDELAGSVCRDASGNGHTASPESRRAAGLERTDGVFGRAMSFTGTHKLQVPGKPQFGTLGRISFSAWTRPKQLGGYREIFRKEDGDQRVLFSYQFDGTVLSLGLNIGGYVECHGKIDPARALDGKWHYCAATFDGQVMRVYFDGQEIQRLDRPGTIVAGGQAPGCIGSSDGGECFQGALDDLRIYADALGADEIRRLYLDGRLAIEHRAAAPRPQQATGRSRRVEKIYPAGERFAQTLALCHKRLLEAGQQTDLELLDAVVRRLRRDFSQDCDRFQQYVDADLVEYLLSSDDSFHLDEVGRLVEMALEYKPLTEEQWRRQPAEARQKWAEVEAIRQRFDRLKAQGDAVRFSPEWIELAMEAGSRIQWRPHVHEAVAPYVRPSTPETRSLTPDEARDVLQRDWLHQADDNPRPERIASEIRWTRQLAARIQPSFPEKVRLARELDELEKLSKQVEALTRPSAELYFAVRRIKRKIALGNPLVDFDKVLFVDMPYPQGSEWAHETRHRLGYMAVPGGRLLVLDGLWPGGKLTQLMPRPPLHGSFWRPDLSFDAKKVVFCFKPHNEKSFHLYEIGVDGSGLAQLTDGIYDDLDPICLPDGHILFSTTRAHTYVRCMPPTNAYVLARCDGDGKNIYLVSYNNEPDYLPSVMNDGRVLYTRWEYTDKPLWRAEKLWTMNPDGTQAAMFWGNQSVWPDLTKDARPIPGSRAVMFTGSAHHNWFSGSVGIIDADRGLNFPQGVTKITADVGWPECGNGPVDPVESPGYHPSGSYPAYYSPYPLSRQDFLVSANRGGKFLLYLMDTDGNRELIYEGVNNIFHALPLRPRARPPVVADRVAWPGREDRREPQKGVIYSGNVYDGAPAELRGKAKYLRVLHIDPKTYTYWYQRPYISTGPVVSAVQSEGVKRIFGTVPIEADGSVAFYVPPVEPVHFQLLDENYRALQTMRSFVGVMPGERRGCLGCHELHSRTPPLEGLSLALRKEPRQITPPPWPDDTVSYPRYVQPVLNQYCGKCHQGKGEAVKVLDLTERPSAPVFTEPYLTLIGRPTWGQPYVAMPNPPPGWAIANVIMVEAYGTVDPLAYRTPQPMTHLSYKSRLVDLCSSGKHYGVKVDPINLQRVIAWVDAMAPYRGDEEVRAIPDPEFQGVDWLAIRPRIRTAPRIIRPGPVD